MSDHASHRPNILFIMTDQHRHDLMTCAGRGLVPTPNIDRIAARGVRFTHAYCPYPVCAASRMALLLRRWPRISTQKITWMLSSGITPIPIPIVQRHGHKSYVWRNVYVY